MRRALALSWALGTSTGVLLGLSGVQLVTSGITGERIAPLSRPEVLQALSAGNTPEASEAIAAPASTPDTGSAPPLPDPVSKPASKPPASAPPRPGATAGTTTTTVPPPPPATPPTTAAPPAPAAPPPAPEPTTTTTTAPRGEIRTISSRGGTVAVHFEDGTVRLLWARPNQGYDVVVEDDGPDKVSVRFRSGGSRSFVSAYYQDGEPTADVEERGPGKNRDSQEYEGVRQTSYWDADLKDRWDR